MRPMNPRSKESSGRDKVPGTPSGRSTICPVIVKLLEELSERGDGEPGWGLVGDDLGRRDPPDPDCLREGGIVYQGISPQGLQGDGSHREEGSPSESRPSSKEKGGDGGFPRSGGLPSPLRGFGIFWVPYLGLAPQATCRRP